MPKEKYTKEVLAKAAKESRSFRDLSIRVGAGAHGGSIQAITDKVKRFGIDTSHFTGFHWSKGVVSNKRIPTSTTLSKGGEQKAHRLRRALLEIGRDYRCEPCGLVEWMGKSLSLQIDHIDGDRNNNQAINLRFICPNCHSQTETFCFNGKSHKGIKR